MCSPHSFITIFAGARSPRFSHAFPTIASRFSLVRVPKASLNPHFLVRKSSMVCSYAHAITKRRIRIFTSKRQHGQKAMRSGKLRSPRTSTGERKLNGPWKISKSISHMIACHPQSFEPLVLSRVRLPKSI